MDMLTHERKRVKYARALIEIEASKPKITEMEVELPIGDVAIKFEYEQDFKLCSICHKVGHLKNDCIHQKQNETVVEDINTTNNSKRNHSRSVASRPGASRGRSRVGKTYKFAPSRPSSNAPANVAVEKKLRVTEEVPALEMVTVSEPFQESGDRIETSEKIDKGKSIVACEDMALPSTSCIAGLDAEGFKVVSNKKKQKKKLKNKMDEQNRGTNKEMTVFFGDMEDTSSCNTEYVDLNNINNSARYFGNQDMGPQPTIASGYKRSCHAGILEAFTSL
ncbi:uncharacterized protein LOC142521125 [Primulina tabacum]|uniref:uncharacterized protein LOC142521125 n=1 Tax=Primulina tabacum TaxID=48773 RepID=UPI003F5A2188